MFFPECVEKAIRYRRGSGGQPVFARCVAAAASVRKRSQVEKVAVPVGKLSEDAFR